MSLKNSIVVIPARKNSKRIKGKNLRLLDAKPLISYSIEYALNFIKPEKIWVNSDDDMILDLSEKYNVSTYKRPDKLAKDTSLTGDVILAFSQFLNKKNIDFKHIVTLQPTNPVRSKKLLKIAFNELKKSKRKSLMSVSLLQKKFGRLNKDNYSPINYRIGQRHQDLENLYFENGLIYISTIETLLNDKKFISDDVYPLITNEIGNQIDIDFEDDLQLAELIIKKNNQ